MKNKLIKIIAGLLVLAGLGGGVIAYQQSQADGFHHYKESRDKEFLHKVFDENLYWLYAGDPKTFSLDHLLTTRILNHGLSNYNVDMYVYTVDKKPVGFVAYYMKTFTKGILLFLVVDKDQRGHGYGEKLIRYACDKMFKKGAQVIQILTYLHNTSALKLYQGLGFKEFHVDGQFVQLEYLKPVL